MPRNGSGQYNPLTNTWNPPVTGVLATGADFQAQLNDISAAITQSVSKDGQTPMTANLPMGNNSIVGIASGTETSPSISANGDTNTGLYFPATDTVAIVTGGVKRVEVDASGRLLVGYTSNTDGSALQIDANKVGSTIYTAAFNNSSTSTAAYNTVRFQQGATGSAAGYLGTGGSTVGNAAFQNTFVVGTQTSHALVFTTNDTERSRITSDGNLLVGCTSGGSYPTARLSLSTNSNNNVWNVGPYAISSNFIISQGTGGVVLNGTATAWSAISDEREKTEIKTIENATSKICTLRAGTGRYLNDEEHVSRSFLIAQDVLAVLPEAVDVCDDEQKTLMLRYTDVIPLLVAGIQEQQAIIQQLTARITALEAK